MTTKVSPRSVEDTVSRLYDVLESKGIKLFEPNDGKVLALGFFAVGGEFVINFAGAKENTIDPGARRPGGRRDACPTIKTVTFI